jgi:hypothetical protein
MTVDPNKVYDSSNLQELNDDFLAERLAEVFPDGLPVAADVAAHDEFARRQSEIHTEMMATTLGSPRMKALEANLESLLKQRYPEPTPAASKPAASTRAQPADAAQQPQAIYAELEKVNPGSPRAKELQANLERVLQRLHPEDPPPSEPASADVDESALAASSETVRYAADTPPAVQRAFSALAGELGVPVAEAQAAHDAIAQSVWLPADEFHRQMAAEWGSDYADNLRRAAGELQALHGPLRDQIEARMADDTFSPELARRLVSLPTLRARGRG